MDEFIDQLSQNYPDLAFEASNSFCWSPKHQKILYDPKYDPTTGIWAILHELGHATLGHLFYSSDFELVQLEAAAWREAQKLGRKYAVKIDNDHIQNCLDTYRDWLHRRSKCPICGNVSLQVSSSKYKCFNCHTEWGVSTSRFCRPYRQLERLNKKSSNLSQTIFI
jgi:hypothetical protein